MKSRFQVPSLLSALLLPPSIAAGGTVVINEVHFHPPAVDGRGVEFIELHNPGSAPISMSGWRLKAGVEVEFAEGTVIEAGGFLVACKDCGSLYTRFGGSSLLSMQGYEGSLEDGGETIELVNADNALVDAVTYDDRSPWPEAADGKGASLERICATARSDDPLNWAPGQPPSPGMANRDTFCPPPPFLTPPVVITEILYHPATDPAPHAAVEEGEEEEFIELHNPGAAAVNLRGWSFGEGVGFTFPDVSIPPGGYLVVGRNADRLREEYGLSNVAGNFTGKLSNRGERLSLQDDRGRWVDSVNYADAGEWPYAADGLGRSLEKIVATGPSSDPANWEAAVADASSGFRRLSGSGMLGQGLSQRLIVSIDGAGEAIVDNILMEDLATPGVNLITNGDFDLSVEGWIAAGSLSGSTHAPTEGVGGTGGFRVVSNAPCPNGECGAANSVSTRLPLGLDRDATYRVTIDVRHIRGSPKLQAGLFKGATASLGEVTSAGRANTVSFRETLPSITHVNRFPVEPRSSDRVWLTALVEAPGPTTVTLTYAAGAGDVALPMLDDGLHRDGAAGDGVHGAELPPFPHDTQVRYRIEAVREGRTGRFPRSIEPGVWLGTELAGYYVNDLQPDSKLPTHHILLDGLLATDWLTLGSYLNCTTPVKGHFAFEGDLYPDVGVRFRGHTACAQLFEKKNLKVVFNRGRLFKGLGKINLNGMWTDKALVREHLSWEFVRQIGAPYFHTEYTRVHLNGKYHGLFIYLDHHGDEFLDRNELADGNLYLSKQPAPQNDNPRGVEFHATEEGFKVAWEKETNENSDFSDLVDFVGRMHRGEGLTAPFWSENSYEEMNIGYQLTQVVLNNIDSFAKNHFLYHDIEAKRWAIITWDLDLTFGKFFTRRAVGPGRPVGTLNDLMLSDPDPSSPGDLNPWFGATVLGNDLLHHLVDFFFRAGSGHYQRAYLVRLWDILMEKYRNETYDPQLEALFEFLRSEELEDHVRWGRYPTNVPGFPEDMRSNIEVIKRQIALHRDFLIRFVETHHAQIPAHPRMKITEVMYWPEGGNDDLEFLEILNTSGREIDISGWTLSGITYTFPAGSIIPPGALIVLARAPGTLLGRYPEVPPSIVFGPYSGRLANEGEEIRLLDAGPGFPATIDYLKYDSEGPWPSVEPGKSIELTSPGPDRDNDFPENWMASRFPGGSPGRSSGGFIRSDSNGDFVVNITDSIFLLAHLFMSGPGPGCADAADVNDDGSLSTEDAIYLLHHLFLSGPEPPLPYPVDGTDATPDALAC